jgi:hypothetical protein
MNKMSVISNGIGRPGLRLAIAAIGLVGAQMAFAQTVQINETGLGNGVWSGGLQLPVQPLSSANYWSGLQTISVIDGANATSFLAFCVDPAQWAPGAYTTYTKTDLSTSVLSGRVADITALYNEAYAGALVGNGTAGAMQLALWEVANDNRDLASGNVHTVSSTNSALTSGAQGLLDHLGNFAGPSQYSFTLYTSSTNQDYLVATPIPEPETYMMLLAGLGLMGFVARRRKSGLATA